AEIIKAGFIAESEILRLVQADPRGATVPHGPHTRELVERAINVKDRVCAAEVGHLAGYLSADDVALHKRLLTDVGLPVAYPRSAWPELRATMSLDKKARGTRLR